MKTEYDNTIELLTDSLKRPLAFVLDEIKHNCEEIRLRVDSPICLTVKGGVLFVCRDSTVCDALPKNALIASKNDIQQTLSLLCRQSVYLHENEIKQGFISLPHGGRAGVCGVFNGDGMLIGVSSVNIRIARQIFGCAKSLLPYADGGLLIAGPPGSGKTTILRDLVRLLSNGENGRYYRVSVIDGRGEIGGLGTLDLGVNTDVLNMLDKAKGTEIALRSMFPDFIAFDEIGTMAELNSVKGCFNAGVKIITTAHCSTKTELFARDVVRQIIESGAVSTVAILSKTLGAPPQIINIGEFKKHAND